MAICILQDAFCSGANDKDGCKMPLTAFSFSFPDNVEERCFERLARRLEDILVGIESYSPNSARPEKG
ncbi:hypothetical protein NKI72_26915 [Mesorhizobium sp. M0437]|uniref:hypothetical protein n=1 Tax=Mesorhizobium sp. M0437 TaxID=2956945 RepID=UPI00333BD459